MPTFTIFLSNSGNLVIFCFSIFFLAVLLGAILFYKKKKTIFRKGPRIFEEYHFYQAMQKNSETVKSLIKENRENEVSA